MQRYKYLWSEKWRKKERKRGFYKQIKERETVIDAEQRNRCLGKIDRKQKMKRDINTYGLKKGRKMREKEVVIKKKEEK